MGDLTVPKLACNDDPAGERRARIRVVLADDHPLVRRSLRHVLEHEGIEVVDEAEDHKATVGRVIDRHPEVLVFDLTMPNGSGMETIGLLHQLAPATRIVVVTMQNAPSFARAALSRGAIGFIVKEFSDNDLGPAVRAAARDERYVSQRVSASWAGAA